MTEIRDEEVRSGHRGVCLKKAPSQEIGVAVSQGDVTKAEAASVLLTITNGDPDRLILWGEE